MMFQRILVPVDFSPASDAAVRAASEIAARYRAAVALVHAVPLEGAVISVVEPVYLPPEVTRRWDSARATEAERRLAELAAQVRAISADVDVTTEILHGPPIDEIVTAAGRGADLVVIGSSGLGGAARLVLGSVAEAVSRAAPCPVLVVHAREAEKHASFRRILVGVDFSPLSEGVCRVAAAVGGPGVKLDIVHVWSPPQLSVLTVDLSDVQGSAQHVGRAIADQLALIARRLARFADDLDLAGVTIQTHVALGGPVDELRRRIDETGPDLVAVGSHAREGLAERLLGTVADRLLRDAGRPVLLLPRPARDRWTRQP